MLFQKGYNFKQAFSNEFIRHLEKFFHKPDYQINHKLMINMEASTYFFRFSLFNKKLKSNVTGNQIISIFVFVEFDICITDYLFTKNSK